MSTPSDPHDRSDPVPGEGGDGHLVEGRLDDSVAARLRAVEPVAVATRRHHLDAALAEYDRLHAGARPDGQDEPASGSRATVHQLPRRSRRLLAAAAAIVVAAIGVGMATQIGSGGAGQLADRAATGTSASTSTDATTSAAAPPSRSAEDAFSAAKDAASPTPRRSTGDTESATASASANPVAGEAPLDTAQPRRTNDTAQATGSGVTDLGSFRAAGELRAALQARSGAHDLPGAETNGAGAVLTGAICRPVRSRGALAAVGTATVSGQRRVVAVYLSGPDDDVVSVRLSDPATCRPI
jgi:hypothetical protein